MIRIRKGTMLKRDAFFRVMQAQRLAITFDDVKLQSGHSDVDLATVPTASWFARRTPLIHPLVSSAMIDVTETAMAIAMAKYGCLGIIHKAMEPSAQAAQVRRVKLHLNGLIEKPISVHEEETIESILAMLEEKEFQFHSLPVLNAQDKLVGLLTRNDFGRASSKTVCAKDVMTPFPELISAPAGTTSKKANEILCKARKNALPLVNKKGELAGMYVFSDVKRVLSGISTHYNLDKAGHLIVGAAIGTGEQELLRAKLLIEAGVDVIVLDSAHGDHTHIYDTLKQFKKHYDGVDIVVGNVSQGESAKRLVNAGADGIKVGQGPGSICTTRRVAGIGCPQVTAVYNCEKSTRGSGVPICADGGFRFSGDITIAIGAGADSVMLGGILAGTTETPGEIVPWKGKQYKVYRGMGSLELLKKNRASRQRYGQEGLAVKKLVAEGIKSRVPFRGPVIDVLTQQIGGLRLGMGYVGANSIEDLQKKGDFDFMTQAGVKESQPHDVEEVDEA